jgi:hypothetical protein
MISRERVWSSSIKRVSATRRSQKSLPLRQKSGEELIEIII